MFVISHSILSSLQHVNSNQSLMTLLFLLLSQYCKDIMELFSHMVRQVRVRHTQCKVDKVINEVSFHVLFDTFFRQSKAQHIQRSISCVQHFYNCTISSLLIFWSTHKRGSKKSSYKFTNVQVRA